MIFHRRVPVEVGEWDERLRGYWVDCDWCKRIQNAGGPIYCVPTARVWHFEQNRPGRRKSVARIRLFNDGARQFYIKHHTLGWWDPRAWLAAVLLSARTVVQLGMNLFARPNEPAVSGPCAHPPVGPIARQDSVLPSSAGASSDDCSDRQIPRGV